MSIDRSFETICFHHENRQFPVKRRHSIYRMSKLAIEQRASNLVQLKIYGLKRNLNDLQLSLYVMHSMLFFIVKRLSLDSSLIVAA